MSNSPSWPVERAGNGKDVMTQPAADPGIATALGRAYEQIGRAHV